MFEIIILIIILHRSNEFYYTPHVLLAHLTLIVWPASPFTRGGAGPPDYLTLYMNDYLHIIYALACSVETAMSTRYLLLKGGRVIDPANKIDREPFDVLFDEKKVIEVGEDVELPEGGELLDVRGCLVCPGLIDLHVHCFPGGTLLGVDPDEWCLKRGVTTVVDAGSAGNLSGL